MSYKERIATNVKWDVDEMDAVMYLCDMSSADCAYSLNVDVYKFEAMSIGDKIRLMKQTYSGEENINKLYELLNLPTSISIPDNVCYIDSYLYNKYGYHTKSFEIEEKTCNLQRDWHFVVTRKYTTDLGFERYHTKIMTFKGSHNEVEQKILELSKLYSINGFGSASMYLYTDNDEKPSQYTSVISFTKATVTIIAYDAEKVEPLE